MLHSFASVFCIATVRHFISVTLCHDETRSTSGLALGDELAYGEGGLQLAGAKDQSISIRSSGMARWGQRQDAGDDALAESLQGDYRCDVMYEGIVDSRKVTQLDF